MDHLSTSSGNRIVVVGDFNFQLNQTDNPDTRSMLDIISTYGLKQHVKESTHRKRPILDLILIREDEISEIDVSNQGPVMSDHSALSFHLPFHRPYSQQETITYWKIQNIDIEQFVKDVEASDLCANREDNLNDLKEQYNTTLQTILDKHAPQIKKIK